MASEKPALSTLCFVASIQTTEAFIDPSNYLPDEKNLQFNCDEAYQFLVNSSNPQNVFFCFFNSAPVSYNFCLLCLKMVSFILSDGEFFLVFRYIWFIYVFSNEKWVFFHF